MSKMKRMAQAVRARALAAIETGVTDIPKDTKKTPAAREVENSSNNPEHHEEAKLGEHDMNPIPTDSSDGKILEDIPCNKTMTAVNDGSPSSSSDRSGSEDKDSNPSSSSDRSGSEDSHGSPSSSTDKADAKVKDASAAPSGSPGVPEGKSCAQCAEPGIISSVGCPSRGGKKAGPPIRFSRGGHVPDIFPDGEVCRLLGKNRAYLIRSRKSKSRGEDWDVIGHHAGMTASWILKENKNADFEHITQWRIKPGDGVVSVEVLQHTMDCKKLACKRLSDGATVVVMVDDASRFRDGEQFDAQELGGTYRWNEALNRI